MADGTAQCLADCLMTEAYAQNRNRAGQLADDILAYACVTRTTRTGGEDDMGWCQRTDLINGNAVISDDLDIRLNAAGELIQIIGKAVVIVDQ